MTRQCRTSVGVEWFLRGAVNARGERCSPFPLDDTPSSSRAGRRVVREVLFVFCDHVDEAGEAWVGPEAIAAQACVTDREAREALTLLKRAGVLVDTGRRVGRGSRAIVWGIAPELWAPGTSPGRYHPGGITRGDIPRNESHPGAHPGGITPRTENTRDLDQFTGSGSREGESVEISESISDEELAEISNPETRAWIAFRTGRAVTDPEIRRVMQLDPHPTPPEVAAVLELHPPESFRDIAKRGGMG